MPFTYKLSKRLAQMHAGDPSLLVAGAALPVSPIVQPHVLLSPSQFNRVVSPSEELREGLS